VTAYLLKKAGHEVIGATMSIWSNNEHVQSLHNKDACYSPHEKDDMESARKVCQFLDIPYHVFDCTEAYKKLVLNNFRSEYLAGRTPNPCIWCNATIKFDALPLAAKESGLMFDKFATGHYARLDYHQDSQRYQLKAGLDEKKDQSYFLYRLKQEQLAKILLPLGDHTKQQIRQIAREIGLKDVSEKPDSQDFYSGDINDIIGAKPKIGNFVNKDGKVLGQHHGIWNYTIGQRKGIGISSATPLYVIGFNKDKNEIVLGEASDNLGQSLMADNLAWLSIAGIEDKLIASAKIRSSQAPEPVMVYKTGNDEVKVEFKTAQKSITPGQSVVFYDEDVVLGGGIIK